MALYEQAVNLTKESKSKINDLILADFEISSPVTRKQILGGGPYEGGAGWALGLERIMKAGAK